MNSKSFLHCAEDPIRLCVTSPIGRQVFFLFLLLSALRAFLLLQNETNTIRNTLEGLGVNCGRRLSVWYLGVCFRLTALVFIHRQLPLSQFLSHLLIDLVRAKHHQ